MSIKSYSDTYVVHAWRDNNRTLKITSGECGIKFARFSLTDDHGAINIPDAALIQYAGKNIKTSAEILITGNILDHNKSVVEFEVGSCLSKYAGLIQGEIRIVSDTGVLKFSGINFVVGKGVSNQAAEQSDEFSALVDALSKVAAVTADGAVAKLDDLEAFDKGNGTNPVASKVLKDILDRYVQKTRTIAGVDLADDIEANELRDAINAPKIFITHTTPLSSDEDGTYANVGDFYFQSGLANKLYLCSAKTLRSQDMGEPEPYTYYEYTWKEITSSDTDNIDLSDYVPCTRTVAGMELIDDITVEEIQNSLRTYPILYDSDPETIRQKIWKGQLAICNRVNFDEQTDGTDEQITYTRDIYYGLDRGESILIAGTSVNNDEVPRIIKQYFEENPVEGGSVDLSGYVPNTRTIAGIDLQDDITAEEIIQKLILVGTKLPTTSEDTVENRQIYLVAKEGKTDEFDAYICLGRDGSNYRWGSIGNVDLSGYVPNTRKIADIELSEDITTKELRDALGVEDMELYSYATRIQSAQTPNTLTLALMADTHYCDNDDNATNKLDTAQTMGTLSHYADIDAIVNLGDIVNGNETKSETIDDLIEIIDVARENAKCPVYFARGNHDDNGWYSYEGVGTSQPSEIINTAEWCQLVGNTFVTDENNPNGGYGYFEHEKSRIRVFVLNSSDIPYILENSGVYRYNGYQCYAFSDKQLNFVANALKFEDKENPNEWAAMFLMHVPLDTTEKDGYRFGCPHALVRGSQQMLSIITAYKNGTSYEFNGSVNDSTLGELAEDFAVNINIDYSEKGVGDVICFVNGHTHTDNVSQEVGYEHSLSYGYTYLGIVGSTAFATMVVDREKNIVTTFKYGKVKTQNESTHNIGAIDGEIEFDIDMSTGTWIIPFEQFRPTAKNLYNGLSELWGDNYIFDSSATLDLNTLELSTATSNEKYALSKAVPFKTATQYMIPFESGGSLIYQYTNAGKYNGQVTPTDGDGYKIITDKYSNGGYFVFCFHKPTYPNYENFYIKEVGGVDEPTEEVEYIETPATAEIGQTIAVSQVDENGKPTEWEAVDFPSGDNLDLSGYVPNTRKIADLELTDDITVEQLYQSLNIKPHTVSYTAPTESTEGRIGELYFSIQTKKMYTCVNTSSVDEGTIYHWEQVSNPDIIKALNSSSTDEQVPSAKLLYDTNKKNTDKIDEIVSELGISVDLYNGLSGVHVEGYTFNPSTAVNALDIETLEVKYTSTESGRVLSKAIPVKANTKYITPSIGGTTIAAYNASGKCTGTRSRNSTEGTITTQSNDAYLVFSFHKYSYADYANFYIKEYVEQVEYIESPATAEVGQTLVVKSVDESGKPIEWEAVDLPNIDELEKTLQDILEAIEQDKLSPTTVGEIEKIVVSYFENKTVGEVEQ